MEAGRESLGRRRSARGDGPFSLDASGIPTTPKLSDAGPIGWCGEGEIGCLGGKPLGVLDVTEAGPLLLVQAAALRAIDPSCLAHRPDHTSPRRLSWDLRARRVHADLTLGQGVRVSHNAVEMGRATEGLRRERQRSALMQWSWKDVANRFHGRQP